MRSRFAMLVTLLACCYNQAHAQAPLPVADARQSQQTKTRTLAEQLANECQTLVSYRLGGLMTLKIERVVEPIAPATIWAVVGEDKKKTPPISFICQFAQKGQGWELSKLELLQLAPETKVAPPPAP